MPDRNGDWTEDELESRAHLIRARALLMVLDAIGAALSPCEEHLCLQEPKATPWDQSEYGDALQLIERSMGLEIETAYIAAEATRLLQGATVHSHCVWFPKP
jgi:hypothetical protein